LWGGDPRRRGGEGAEDWVESEKALIIEKLWENDARKR